LQRKEKRQGETRVEQNSDRCTFGGERKSERGERNRWNKEVKPGEVRCEPGLRGAGVRSEEAPTGTTAHTHTHTHTQKGADGWKRKLSERKSTRIRPRGVVVPTVHLEAEKHDTSKS